MAFKLMTTALDQGVPILDTAASYNEGASEAVVGRFVRTNGNRSRLVICTKFHVASSPGFTRHRWVTRRQIIIWCEESLQRLKTDHLDIFLAHHPHHLLQSEELIAAFDELLSAGKTRFAGTSNFSAAQTRDNHRMAEGSIAQSRFVEQPPYNLLDRSIEMDLLPTCLKLKIPLLTWSPLGGGLLTGKYRENHPPPADSRFAEDRITARQQKRWSKKIFKVIEPLRELSAELGISMAQISLAWVRQQNPAICPILGARNTTQLLHDLTAARLNLSKATLRAIDSISQPTTSVSRYAEGI